MHIDDSKSSKVGFGIGIFLCRSTFTSWMLLYQFYSASLTWTGTSYSTTSWRISWYILRLEWKLLFNANSGIQWSSGLHLRSAYLLFHRRFEKDCKILHNPVGSNSLYKMRKLQPSRVCWHSVDRQKERPTLGGQVYSLPSRSVSTKNECWRCLAFAKIVLDWRICGTTWRNCPWCG